MPPLPGGPRNESGVTGVAWQASLQAQDASNGALTAHRPRPRDGHHRHRPRRHRAAIRRPCRHCPPAAGDHLLARLQVAAQHLGHRAVGVARRHLHRLRLAVGALDVDRLRRTAAQRRGPLRPVAARAEGQRSGDAAARSASRRAVARLEAQRRIGDEQHVLLVRRHDIRGRGHARAQLQRRVGDGQVGGIAHHLVRRGGRRRRRGGACRIDRQVRSQIDAADRRGKVRPGKASTVKVAFCPVFTSPTSPRRSRPPASSGTGLRRSRTASAC